MKKNLCVMLLAVGLTAAIPAQEASGAKIAVGLDVMPLLKGIIWSDNKADNSLFALSPSFEYRIAPHFSVGGSVDLWFGEASKINIFYFGLAGRGRWYPLAAGFDKLFVEAALGFNVFSLNGETDADKGGMAGMLTGLKAGWKLMFGPKFFVEPSMAYVYAKTNSVSAPTPLGWQAGLNVGTTF
ncbi:MAG: hypothetical protein LBB77_02975 [Treponema sp.]|jgi:hypothetical protein|nr:hypothetical protein [Treponema sp.]